MPARYKLLSHQKQGVLWKPVLDGQEHLVEAKLGDWLGELNVYVDGAPVGRCRQVWVRFANGGELEEVEGDGGLVDRAIEVYTEFVVAGRRAVISSSGIFSYRHELAIDEERVADKQGVGPGNRV